MFRPRVRDMPETRFRIGVGQIRVVRKALPHWPTCLLFLEALEIWLCRQCPNGETEAQRRRDAAPSSFPQCPALGGGPRFPPPFFRTTRIYANMPRPCMLMRHRESPPHWIMQMRRPEAPPLPGPRSLRGSAGPGCPCLHLRVRQPGQPSVCLSRSAGAVWAERGLRQRWRPRPGEGGAWGARSPAPGGFPP